MSTAAAFPDASPDANLGIEQPRLPWQRKELLGQYLEMDHESVMALLLTTEGREQLYEQLMDKRDILERDFPELDILQIRRDLDALGQEIELERDTLQQKERFLTDVHSPEKKGVMRRALDSVKNFAKKHPVVTTLLVASLAAAGVAGGFYFTGNWELLLNSIGLDTILGGAGAAEELLPVTPPTEALPGGGIFDVPPPTSPVPGTGIPT